MSETRPPPSFTGLIVHREPAFACSFLIPEGWHRLELESDVGSGVIYAPDAGDVQTSFSFEGRDLGTEVEPDDLAALEQGFLSGLRQVSASRIESHEAEAIGRLITMEARHTFDDGGAVRQRWVRLLYQGSTQVRLIAQGATPAEFGYWEPMFFQTMRTFRFADWWGEVTGASWADSAFNENAETTPPPP